MQRLAYFVLGPERFGARQNLLRRIWILEVDQLDSPLAEIRGHHGVRAEAPTNRRITGQLIQSGMSAASEYSSVCHPATLI